MKVNYWCKSITADLCRCETLFFAGPGLENIYHLTLQRSYRLRIDMADFDNDARFVIYNKFALSPLAISAEEDNYKLYIDGFEEGDPSRPAGEEPKQHYRWIVTSGVQDGRMDGERKRKGESGWMD